MAETDTLRLELVDQPYGRCRAILTDGSGEVVLDQVYKNRASASTSARTKVKKMGYGTAHITRVNPEGSEPDSEDGDEEPDDDSPVPELSPSTTPARPGDRWLHKLRTEAQRVLDEAVKLRERADLLETEHKRLTAAADVLEGPES